MLEAVTFGMFAEVQRAVSAGVSGVQHVWSGYVGLRGLKAENDMLKRDLAATQVAVQEQRALADRTRGLEQLLGMRDRAGLRTVAAERCAYTVDSVPECQISIAMPRPPAGPAKTTSPSAAE